MAVCSRSMGRRFALLLLLGCVHAHPPHDAAFDDPDVQAIATESAAALNATDWRLLSAQKQLVSGMNYFLVLAIAQQDAFMPFAAWRLCSCRVYTTFIGGIVSLEHELAPAVAVPPAAAAQLNDWGSGDADGGGGGGDCSAEMRAPSPLHSTATVEVSVMTGGGGGGSITSHEEVK